MTFFQTVLLSAIEGITEFLPVSSTGHLILASELLGIPQDAAHVSFEISIQLGAILAAVVLYSGMIMRNPRLLTLALVGFLPTGVIGFLLHDIVTTALFRSDVVVWSLALGGIALIVFEWCVPEDRKGSLTSLSFPQAFVVGIAQAVAVIPGVSRAAATILGGQAMGLSRRAIVEFSFLLAVPTMLAATGWNLLQSASAFTSADARMLLIGFVLSFLFALLSIRWFLRYISTHSFVGFGMYRILVAIFFWLSVG